MTSEQETFGMRLRRLWTAWWPTSAHAGYPRTGTQIKNGGNNTFTIGDR